MTSVSIEDNIQLLASGSRDGSVQVCDSSTGDIVACLLRPSPSRGLTFRLGSPHLQCCYLHHEFCLLSLSDRATDFKPDLCKIFESVPFFSSSNDLQVPNP